MTVNITYQKKICTAEISAATPNPNQMFLLRTPSLLFPKPWGGITSIRFCSDSHGKSNDLNEEIRVRFAPSPTGSLSFLQSTSNHLM